MNDRKKLPGNYITLNEMIYANDKIRELPCSAQLAWIYLISWSKHNRKDGAFGKAAALVCGASPDDLTVLMAANLIEGRPSKELPYAVVNWHLWQTTNAEIDQMRTKKSKAGKAGGRTRPPPSRRPCRSSHASNSGAGRSPSNSRVTRAS